jgi:acyl-CoA synthetase (AMP-forming)/AMP-acid ligase II
MNVAELMYRNARKYPDKEAIVFKELRLNYQEINSLSNQFANAIINLGINKGDRVAMMMRNSEKFVAVYFGILKAGAVVVPINISLVKAEVQFIVNNCEAKMFIYDEVFAPIFQGIETELPTVNNFVVVGSDGTPNKVTYRDLMDNASDEMPGVDIDENDRCSIIYTSGTTGTPRGAVFSHRGILYTVCNSGALGHRMNINSRNLAMMPLFHSAPLHLYFLGAIYVGGSNVILEAFDPKLFLQTIQDEKTTHFFGPAVVYLTCAKLLDVSQYDLSSMEMFVLGGSPKAPG